MMKCVKVFSLEFTASPIQRTHIFQQFHQVSCENSEQKMEQNTAMLCILVKTMPRMNLKLWTKQMRTDQYCDAKKAEFLEISKLKRMSLQQDSKNEVLRTSPSHRRFKRGRHAIELKEILSKVRVPKTKRNQWTLVQQDHFDKPLSPIQLRSEY